MPGVFAVSDVRLGSINHVGRAMGGACCNRCDDPPVPLRNAPDEPRGSRVDGRRSRGVRVLRIRLRQRTS